ncbi:hypothetical protein ACWELP_06205 [Rhodococcus aetherivorans]
MFRGLLFFDGVEVANTARTVAHIRNGICPPSLSLRNESQVWPHTARMLGVAPFALPTTAPWHDPTDPASLEFAGVMVLSIDGLETSTRTTEVIEGVGDGASFGLDRHTSREVTATALLVAATSAGAAYGLRWLTNTLAAGSATLRFLDDAPTLPESYTEGQTQAAMAPRWRSVHQVTCTTPPTIDSRFGRSEDVQASVLAVRWTWTAGAPHLWHDPVTVLTGLTLAGQSVQHPVWQIAVDGQCDTGCTDPASSVLRDPLAPVVDRIVPPSTAGIAATCTPLEFVRAAATITAKPSRMATPESTIVTLSTGASAVRNLRVQWIRNPVGPVASSDACGALAESAVMYLPASSTLTLHGPTGTAWCDTPTGRLDALAVVRGRAGGPWVPLVLDTADPYALIVDGTPSTVVSIDVATAVRDHR